ncbi:MAG TPA: class I SAM-dependent methyltransferase [Thermoplasmata archaeon]|nr:class I SAM-dependent methyltransferase [Thermoplasmata archaeon]
MEQGSLPPGEVFSGKERLEGEFGWDYAVGWKRADILQYLDLRDKIVIDFGCGWGTYSVPAALQARGVIAVDLTEERLRLLALRARHEKLANMAIVHGDAARMRWRDNSYDIAIVVGLLEWLPSGFDESPRAVQLEFLRRIYGGLRPGGSLLLGIENRLNPFYFVGHTDHGELPFTPLLPRAVAGLLTRVFKRERFTHYLYTHSGYRKLLRTAGFQEVRFIYPVPTYKETVFLATSLQPETMGDYLANRYVGQYHRLARKLEMHALKSAIRLRLAEFLVPTYYVVGERR